MKLSGSYGFTIEVDDESSVGRAIAAGTRALSGAPQDPREIPTEDRQRARLLGVGVDRYDGQLVPCPNCGTQNSRSALMCMECGFDLTRAVPTYRGHMLTRGYEELEAEFEVVEQNPRHFGDKNDERDYPSHMEAAMDKTESTDSPRTETTTPDTRIEDGKGRARQPHRRERHELPAIDPEAKAILDHAKEMVGEEGDAIIYEVRKVGVGLEALRKDIAEQKPRTAMEAAKVTAAAVGAGGGALMVVAGLGLAGRALLRRIGWLDDPKKYDSRVYREMPQANGVPVGPPAWQGA